MAVSRGPHLNTENTSKRILSRRMHKAIEDKDVSLVKAFIFMHQYNVDALNSVGRDGNTPLILAAKVGCAEIVALFIEALQKHQGFGLNFQNHDQATALIMGIYSGDVATVRTLLACPLISISAPVCFRIDALEYANQQGNGTIIKQVENRQREIMLGGLSANSLWKKPVAAQGSAGVSAYVGPIKMTPFTSF